jgi:hypothetical protein
MIDAFPSFTERKPGTKTRLPEARIAPKAWSQPEADQREQRGGFTKVFRWPVPAEQTPQPTTVEVAGTFSEWRKLALIYDRPSKSWQLILHNIQGNHTHRYVFLVDGRPAYDKTCDGLAAPESPEEERWQIETPRGPRLMLLFSQTK